MCSSRNLFSFATHNGRYSIKLDRIAVQETTVPWKNTAKSPVLAKGVGEGNPWKSRCVQSTLARRDVAFTTRRVGFRAPTYTYIYRGEGLAWIMPRRDGTTHPRQVTCNPHLLSTTSGRLTARRPRRAGASHTSSQLGSTSAADR